MINKIYDRVTRYHYNGNDDISRVEKAVGTPLVQDYATYTYHFDGPLESTLMATVTDAENNAARYEYDGYGRPEYWYFPSKTKGAGTDNAADYERYEYDNNGNRTLLVKRQKNETGGDIRIIYDYAALNRQKAKLIPGTTQSVYYQYNNLGLMTSARYGGITMVCSTRLTARASFTPIPALGKSKPNKSPWEPAGPCNTDTISTVTEPVSLTPIRTGISPTVTTSWTAWSI